jgi:hypothetical protein
MNLTWGGYPGPHQLEFFGNFVSGFENLSVILRHLEAELSILKPHCIRCRHFKVEDVSALDAISKPPVRIVEGVTALATYAVPPLIFFWRKPRLMATSVQGRT